MRDFLDTADRLRLTRATDALESFSNVFSAISELQGVFAKSYLDLDNIEALFGAIELGVLIDKVAGRSGDAVRKLREDLVTVIYKTLEARIRFPVDETQLTISPPKTYGDFIREIFGERYRGLRVDAAFITFNYDVALDFALQDVVIDYGLGEMQADAVPLLKLHGSINWGTCDTCNQIAAVPIKDAQVERERDYGLVRIGSSLHRHTHAPCRAPLKGPPMIVPPTWNKTHDGIARVWRNAARVLGAAENIFVIGYSLPETDAFFRYLFALGSESDSRIKRFWVVNPDNSVAKRFEALIGRGIANRFKFIPSDFQSATQEIYTALQES